MTTEFPREKLRVPLEDGQCLQIPELAKARLLWQENQQRFADSSINIGSQSLSQLRATAQRELIDLAIRHTRTYSDQEFDGDRHAGILLTGHQPELYHPGVWYKNFAVSWLGEQLNCTPINLNIDSELCRTASINVPDRLTNPTLVEIPFDERPSGKSFEHTPILDKTTFERFAHRVDEHTRTLGITDAIADSLWKEISNGQFPSDLLGYNISAARHRLESKHGLRTWEVNLSDVCRTRSFANFAAAVLQELPRFVDAYNRALFQYRKAHQLRSKTHPAPDLRSGDAESETPFWIYDKNTLREPLRVSLNEQQIQIRNEGFQLAAQGRSSVTDIADLIYEINQTQTAIRPRALLTTMYARLVLSSCFIHGIGGAKYDLVTDQIIHEFFGIEPPEYLTLSATLLLPLPRTNISPEEVTSLQSVAKQFAYHPERLVDESGATPQTLELIAEKQQLFKQQVPRGQGKQRHQRIGEINSMLQSIVSQKAESYTSQAAAAEAKLQQKQILESREFSFCLFPETQLIENLKRLAR